MRLFLALLFLSTAAVANDAALRTCRQIADPAARLKCYDALRIEPDAPRAVAPAARAPAAPAAAPVPAAKQPPASFGFEAREAAAAAAASDSIESYIPGHFTGYRVGTLIPLANGQVWRVTDGRPRQFDVHNPKVVIRRAIFGSFYLDIGDRADNFSSPHVRRVK